jgi:hypothetical protein
MHAELWCDRNRRPMGLLHSFPFLTRPMNREEIEYHHFDTRLCYHQYEDWNSLLFAEEQEAGELDKEKPGQGTVFLNDLRSFEKRYALRATASATEATPPVNPLAQHLSVLLKKAADFSFSEVSVMLEEEQRGEQRLPVIVLLRELYREKAGERKAAFALTVEAVQRKAQLLEQRRRKNFVRRVFASNPLFALQEISSRYAGYDETQLLADLKRKPGKPKRKKQKPFTDLRRCQLQKLAARLNSLLVDGPEYRATCQRMAILAEAHRQRLPIPVPVKLQQVTKVYYFHWKTRESVVKAFAGMADRRGATHETLQVSYDEMVGSSYSF